MKRPAPPPPPDRAIRPRREPPPVTRSAPPPPSRLTPDEARRLLTAVEPPLDDTDDETGVVELDAWDAAALLYLAIHRRPSQLASAVLHRIIDALDTTSPGVATTLITVLEVEARQ